MKKILPSLLSSSLYFIVSHLSQKMSTADWRSGKSTYSRVTRDGKTYAVLSGRSVDDAPSTFLVKTDPGSGNVYFINAATKQKTWDLPDLAGASGSSGGGAFRARVVAFYNQYNPSKVDTIDSIMAQYEGRESQLIDQLVKKYGPEPASGPAPSGPAASAAAVQPSTIPVSPRDAVVALYMKHDPSKLSNVDRLLTKYSGREDELVKALTEKYEPVKQQDSTGDAVYRQRVLALYQQYCPDKVDRVDGLVAKYKGSEEVLLKALVDKWGPEPPMSPSSPPPPRQQLQEAEQQNASNPSTNDASSADALPPSLRAMVAANDPSSSSTAELATTTQRSTAFAATESAPQLRPEATIVHTSPNSKTSTSSSVPRLQQSEVDAKEAMLVSFVQQRDKEIEAARARLDAATATIEQLRAANHAALTEMASIRKETEQKLTELSVRLSEAKESEQVQKAEWHREKQRLESAVEVASTTVSKQLQLERLKAEENMLKQVGEKQHLQEQLLKAKEELRFIQSKSSDLIHVLSRSEAEQQRLQRLVDELNLKLIVGASEKVTASTQTAFAVDQSTPRGHSPSSRAEGGDGNVSRHVSDPASPHGGETSRAIERFDQALNQHSLRKQQAEHWKSRCAELEKELAAVKSNSPTLIQQGASQGGPCSNTDCAAKLRHLKTLVSSLRTANKALEQRVGSLEMELLSLPPEGPVIPPQIAAAPTNSSAINETASALKASLTTSQATIRAQKKEISELRGRLCSYMATAGRK